MGYAIIKDTNSNKGYALNRQIQNVVPTDSTQWIYIPNTNSISFSYNTENVTDGIYRLSSLTGMSNYRQPYEYELVGTYSNVSVHPISGVITVQEGFTGNNVKVRIKAIYDVYGSCYPAKTGFSNAVSQTITVQNISAPSSTPVTPSTSTYSFSNVSLSYGSSNVSATGGAVNPTLNYTLNKTVNGTTSQSEDTVNVTYSGTMPSSSVTLGSNGKVTFSNNNTDSELTASVTALLTAPDGSTANANGSITQDKRTLNSISFKSYNGASMIVLEDGDYFDPALLSLNLTYNTGSATLAAGQGQITYAINSMTGTQYATRRQMFEGTYTIYFWYNNQYNTVSVTVNAPASGGTNTLTVTSNTGGYALTGTTLTTDDFVVKDSNNNTVSSFTISPTSVNTEGAQTVTITSGNESGTISMQFLNLSSFSEEQALLGITTAGVIDNTTLFAGPSNSSGTPYQESSGKKHLGTSFLQNAKEGDQYLVYLSCAGPNIPTDNSRIMASTQPILDFTNITSSEYDPYLGTQGTGSATGNPPTGYVAPYMTFAPNKLYLYTVGDSENIITDENLILTVFAHFTTSSGSLTTIRYHKVGLTPTYRYSVSSWKTGSSQNSSKPYGDDDEGTITNNILTCEPYVKVLDNNNSTTIEMTLSQYNELQNKTPYTLTYETDAHFAEYNSVGGAGTVTINQVNGTLTYDLAKIQGITSNYFFDYVGVKLVLTNNIDGTTISTVSGNSPSMRQVRRHTLFGLEQAYNMSSTAVNWSGGAQVSGGDASISSDSPYNSSTSQLTVSGTKAATNVILQVNTSYLIKLVSWSGPIAIVETDDPQSMDSIYTINGSTNMYRYIDAGCYIKYTTGSKNAVLLSSSLATTAYLGTLNT